MASLEESMTETQETVVKKSRDKFQYESLTESREKFPWEYREELLEETAEMSCIILPHVLSQFIMYEVLIF